MSSAGPQIHHTGCMDLDMAQCAKILDRVRSDLVYAQNLYAAMCNQAWQYQDVWTLLRDRTWTCSWRTAAQIIADMRDEGDYMDWYCSGSIGLWNLDDDADGRVAEGVITEEIRADLAEIGWHPVVDQ